MIENEIYSYINGFLKWSISKKTSYSQFDLKIKDALYINWRKPNINAQQNDLALTLSL